MRDQQIGYWFQARSVASAEGKAYGVVQTAALQTVVAAFDKNASQVAFLSEFPQEMCMFGQQLKVAEIGASMEVLGSPNYRGLVRGVSKEEADAEDEETSRRRGEEIRRIEALALDMLAGRAENPIPQQYSADSSRLTQFVGNRMRAAYDTMMSAQLVLAWTTFETLAGDLWEAAVNAHPQTLAALRGMKDQSLTSEDKSLPMSFLERHRYDLRDKMGTVLRIKRCKFVSLDDIIKSYRQAFPERSVPNSKPFWENQDLKAASAIRNLIVHKAGLVDDEFKRKTGSDSRLSSWNAGEQFCLDGDLLRQLLRGIFAFSASLIRAVDDWIAANPA